VNSVDGTPCALWPFLRDTDIFTDLKKIDIMSRW
jgi:hypothetical protein